jgi:hypothetical protein
MEGSAETRRVAAVVAVYSYLARAQAAGQAAGARSAGETGGCAPSPWALYGRRALMDQRIRMQARRRA